MTERLAEPDPMLRRFERNQLLAALCLAVAALVVSRRLDVLVGVICGAALMVFSYRAIKGAVTLMMPGGSQGQGPQPGAGRGGTEQVVEARDARGGSDGDPHGVRDASVVRPRRSTTRGWVLAARFVGRYALLALAAYVMLAYLHAHPIGVLVGVASPVIAVAVEAARFVRTSSRPGHSR